MKALVSESLGLHLYQLLNKTDLKDQDQMTLTSKIIIDGQHQHIMPISGSVYAIFMSSFLVQVAQKDIFFAYLS